MFHRHTDKVNMFLEGHAAQLKDRFHLGVLSGNKSEILE